MSTAPVANHSVPQDAKGKTVFFTGATGYIGGAILNRLLSIQTPPSQITVLVRDPKKAELFQQLNTPAGTTLTPLLGSLEDLDKLKQAAESHDIVIQAANADDLAATKALLEGAKKRKAKVGHRTLYIETSGTGLFSDNAKGQYPNDKIYTDLNPTPATGKSPATLSIDSLPDTAPHRNVDLELLAADQAGIIKSYIVMPSTIWGVPKGEIFTKGIANSFSIQLPDIIRASLDRGQAAVVGKGANIWGHIEINDLAELYGLVYAGALRGDIGHGHNGYYNGISGEYTRLSAAQTIGGVLVAKGWAKEAQPTSLTEEEVKKYYNGDYYDGSNSRGVADRSKSLGWRPKLNELEDFVEDLKKEVVRVEGHYGKKVDGPFSHYK